MKALFSVLLGGLALAACGDDTSTSGGGNGGGSGGASGGASGTGGGSTTAASTGPATASASGTTSGSSSAGGDGGDGTGGTGAGGSGSGGEGTGGAADACPDIPVAATITVECAYEGPFALPVEDMAVCTDIGEPWPVQIFQIEVEEGDCVHMRVDNAGSDGAGTFGFIVDPVGDNIWVDELADCAVESPDEYLCAEGALTMSASGDAFVWAGVYVGEACPLGTEVPYQLTVSINGVDVDLGDGPVCRGDLNEIVP